MEFGWSPAQAELYEQTLELARGRLNRGATEREKEHHFGQEEWQLCAAEEHGGMGLDLVTSARVFEALGRGCCDTGLCFSVAAHVFGCTAPIARYGSPELKGRLLPALCSGKWIGANATTEAESSSGAFAMKARAVREGDEFVLHGTKTFVTNGPMQLERACVSAIDGRLERRDAVPATIASGTSEVLRNIIAKELGQ